MWLLFAVLSLLAYASGDLLGKKKIDTGNETTPIEMLLSIFVPTFFIGLGLFASGLGESGKTPWQILLEHPLIIVCLFSFIMYWLLYLVSFRYIGLTLEAAFSGTNNFLYFSGLLLVYAFSGKLASVQEILHPAKLIPVILVITFIFLFPNIEMLAANHTSESWQIKLKQDRHRTVLGLLILFAGLVFDAGETLITTLIFDDGGIGIVDFVTANYFATILPAVLFSLYLRKKNGKWFIPFKDGGKYSICYICAVISASLLYLCASSLNAVKTGILFITAPIFSILGARIILKEKYTWKQTACIWIIVFSIIAFCAAEYMV